MSTADLSGLNAGYVAEMLEAYLDAPGSVPVEWRELFELDPGAVTSALPGLAGLLGRGGTNGTEAAIVPEPTLPERRPAPDTLVLPDPPAVPAPPLAAPDTVPVAPAAPDTSTVCPASG